MLSYAIPGTVMGSGTSWPSTREALQLTGTGAIIVLAFIFRGCPWASGAGSRALHPARPQSGRGVVHAEGGHGHHAPPGRRASDPIAILTGLIYSFVRAMTAVSQVIFLARRAMTW